MSFIPLKKFYLVLFIALFVAIGCREDKPTIPEVVEEQNLAELIVHHWEFHSAKRNGRNAPSLDGLFFDFSKKDSLKTNIMGTEQTNRFELDGNTIRCHGDSPMNFQIDSLYGDSLKLLMSMNNSKFEFLLSKQKGKD